MTEKKKIMIVEDEAITAMELSSRMKKLGYDVVALVSSGKEAIKKAVEMKPDAILMDIKLKGDMDGIEAARQINEIKRIPVFYITAYADESLLKRAKVTEPYAYMVKPFSIREIHSNIEVALHRHEIEQKLIESEDRLRKTIDLVPHQIFLRNSDGLFILVNEALAQSYDTTVNELQGKTLRNIHSDVNEIKTFLEEDAKVLKTNRPLHISEQSFTQSDGTVRWVDTRKIPIQLAGEGACVMGVAVDFTERKRVEEALRVSEERFRNIFEESPLGIDVFDSQGDFIHANKACLNLFGVADVNHLRVFNIFDDPSISKEIKDQIRRGEIVRIETLFDFEEIKRLGLYQTTKSGVYNLYSLYAPMGFDENQKPTSFIVQMQDITERKQAELAKLESEKRYRELFHHLHDGAWVRDIEGNFVDVNHRFLELFGYSRDEVIGHHVLELFSPEHIDEARRLMTEVESSGGLLVETQVRKKDGEIRSVELSSGRIEFGGRSVVQGIARDITDRKRAEQALAEHAHYLGERVKELTCLYETSRLIGSDQSIEQVFEILVGLMQTSWQYPDITCTRAIYNGRVFATPNFKETEWMQSADIIVSGEKRGVLEVCYLEERPTIGEGPFFMEERELINALAENVSRFIERIGAEDALEKSEAKYRVLAEESLQGISMMQDGRVVYSNQAYADISGRTIEELMAYTPEEMFQNIHPDDAEWLMESYGSFLNGKISAPRSEFRIIHKDGTTRWVESYATHVEYEDEPALQIAQIDITERKKAQQNLEEALDNAEFFVDLMGHDLTNINQALSGTLELVLFDESLSTHTAETVNDALIQMKRATRLITNVKKFRSLDECASVLKPIDLERALLSAIQAVQEDFPEKKLEVRTNIDSRRFTVNADEHLNDILYSLLHNAANHHPKEVVDVTVTAEVIDDSKNLRISVADDGNGVPDELKELIFSRISKKKEGYWGTGIGLTLTKHIVDYYNGDIWVEDRVKGNHTEGASFVVILQGHMT